MQMKLLSLWPLFLIQITSMLLTFIILKRNAVSFFMALYSDLFSVHDDG